MLRHGTTALWASAIISVLCTGCMMGRFPGPVMEDTALVPQDGSIEVTVDERGQLEEVEYHLNKSDVPAEVLASVNNRLPGGIVTDVEKEYNGYKMYYEVTKELDGREQEIMAKPNGDIYLMELEIAPAYAPRDVLDTAKRTVPQGTLDKVEKIVTGEEKLLEYHVKMTSDGKHYKIRIETDGTLIKVLREVQAEIEVPVASPVR